MKELKDYLHLYLGCEVELGYDGRTKRGQLVGKRDNFGWEVFDYSSAMIPIKIVRDELIKPILRQLSDMTEEEDTDLCAFCLVSDLEHKQKWDALLISEAKRTTYLLSKHFDLFSLIESGLAIDAKTLQPTTIK